MGVARDRVLTPQGRKCRETRSVTHITTDWADRKKFPRLWALGCRDPEPIIEVDPYAKDGVVMMIRCRVTGLCFSAAEARGREWVPTPEEVQAAMEAKRDSWTEKEAEEHDAYRGETAEERAELNAPYTIPMVAVSERSVVFAMGARSF